MSTRACLALVAGLVLSCTQSVRPAQSLTPRSPIALTYQGVAGWRLDSGALTLLLDPYYSRPKIAPDAKLSSDESAVRAHLPAHADAILVGHSHADHLLDAPTAARLTGANVIGSESSANYLRAAGIPASQVIPIKGGEDFEFGSFSVRVIPSLHSALDGKHGFGGNSTIAATVSLPLAFSDFPEGGTFAYLIRTGGHEILFLDTANFIERELEGIHPDVAVVATGLRGEIHDYSCRLMRVLGHPPVVFANHFDDWRHAPTPTAALSAEIRADLAHFAEEIRACSPGTRVFVPEPFQPNRID